MVPLGRTGGQKLGQQPRETTGTRSTKPFAPPQGDRQAGMSSLNMHEREHLPAIHTIYGFMFLLIQGRSSYREQTVSINGVPLDPHSTTSPIESRFQERGTHYFSEFQSHPFPSFYLQATIKLVHFIT